MERNSWYLGMEKKNRAQSSFDSVIEVVAYGYKVDTRVKPGGGTKARKNHICSERNVFTSGILCTEDSRLADQRSRGIQAERKRA